jgi:uncharacterized protein YlaI
MRSDIKRHRRNNVRKVIFYLVFIILALLVCGCSTGRGAILSNIGDGATEYREIAGRIGDGQAELGITGARIEERSRELEQSISRGAETIQDIGTILQQIRNRPIDAYLIEKWRNSRLKTGNSNGETGEGEI